MTHHTFRISTRDKTSMQDITRKVEEVVNRSGVGEGMCNVYIPHTTCGVTINENADPSVQRDIDMEINKIVPFKDDYHHMEGNSPAHIKASIMGAHVSIPVSEGRLMLGTWQGIYLCEFDGPRSRSIVVSVGD
jgi:secondary thiamine-phosphate synthase enzyme